MDAQDPQKEACYTWEDSWGPWNYDAMTLPNCRVWAEKACALYGIAPPRIRQHRTKAFSWVNVEARVASFGAGGKNVPTVLHEMAHLIAYERFGLKIMDHGPTFLGVYMWLLEWSRIAPRVALHASARAHGLRWRRGFGPKQCKGS